MKPTPKALDPAVFLKAAKLIDSGELHACCFSLDKASGDQRVKSPERKFFEITFKRDAIADGTHPMFWMEFLGERYGYSKKRRIFALLLCAELCRTVRRGTPRGGKGRNNGLMVGDGMKKGYCDE